MSWLPTVDRTSHAGVDIVAGGVQYHVERGAVAILFGMKN